VGNGIGGLSLADIASSAGATLTPTQLSGPTYCSSAGPATVLPGRTFFWVSCNGTETEYNMALTREGTGGGGLPFSAANGVDVAATTSSGGNIALGTPLGKSAPCRAR
jgi:hypothetical protein